MMSGNQVVSRLQQQRSRIQGMLSPGRKDLSGGIHAPLSPVSSDFAGRKFLLAAKKMRVLGDNKISSMFSRSERSLSTEIADKFQGVENIIHINTKTIRDGGIWPDVETTLPGSSKSVQHSARPEAGGTLQQGSVIQKFSTIPKPGQPLESFRQQIESQPRPARPSAVQPRKAVISPGDRLFSRIQEITPSQKEHGIPKLDLQAVPELPIETRSTESVTDQMTNKPSIPRQVADSPKIIQRQVDLPISEDQPIEISEEMPKPDTQRREDVQERLPDPKLFVSKNLQEAESIAVTKEFLTTPTKKNQSEQAEMPVVEKIAQKTELKKAVPVKKYKDKAQESSLKKALPVNRPVTPRGNFTVVQREIAAATENRQVKPSVVLPVSEHALQEGPAKVEKTKTEELIEKRVDRTPPVNASLRNEPDIQQSLDAPVEQVMNTIGIAVQIAASEYEPEETDTTMPLHQVLFDHRQRAESVIRRTEPLKLRHSVKPVLIHFTPSMLATQKNRRKEVPQSLAEISAATRKIAPTMKSGGAQTIATEATTRPADYQGLEKSERVAEPLDLFLPAQSTSIIPEKRAKTEQQTLLAKKSLQTSEKVRPVPRAVTVANIVQRQWEEHTGVERQGSGAGSSQTGGGEGGGSALDLEALAEDVFPFVKRIFEIEVNRGSGKFR